jgi:hypothetical protein
MELLNPFDPPRHLAKHTVEDPMRHVHRLLDCNPGGHYLTPTLMPSSQQWTPPISAQVVTSHRYPVDGDGRHLAPRQDLGYPCDIRSLSKPDEPRGARTAADLDIIFPSPAGPIPSYSFYRSPPLVGSILWLHSASLHWCSNSAMSNSMFR